ncbi:hypothetical protein LTR09_007382 [Extremus antarcticus]|uniref:Uncharacterized protein n=1 Tax=Extremus antarcticus TaxID=702011 RepID=A0AAJ0DCC5_9PEZI|nr:hypothetical protein LTR09_007382 [Extremus antarcticus]
MAEHDQGQNEARQLDESVSQDDDNEPMVHVTPSDNATWAPKEKEKLISKGKESVLMSELPGLVGPKRDDETGADYAKRYSNYLNDLIRRGVSVLGDTITHNSAPNGATIDDHEFDIGPNSGITKKEYREFGDWMSGEGASYSDTPERFLKFEVPKGTSITY